jgi:UDP-N-acetylmuramoyl-tripeptide--D-alanyl-D-alanine ligase
MKKLFKKMIEWIIGFEARVVLRKYKPQIITITGSVGKTSTKDAIYAVLKNHLYVRRNEKSFNGELGVPLTILGCQNAWTNPFLWIKNVMKGLALIFLKNHYPKWLILEIGADRPGDIEKFRNWFQPDIVVMTKMGETPVHVEFFKSSEDILKEKALLVDFLKKDGLLVLNEDEEKFSFLKEKGRKTISYGLTEDSSVYASNYIINYTPENRVVGAGFKVNYSGNTVPVSINGSIGKHLVYPCLAAFAVAVSLDINMVNIVSDFATYSGPNGRMRIIQGVKGSIIIDDSYNSSPVALSAAVQALADIKGSGRKIAILGDMAELGKYSEQAHKEIGIFAASVFDILITVGKKARGFVGGALMGKMDEEKIFQFEDARQAGKYAEILVDQGDLVLIKGSQSIRMEKATEEIMAQPQDRERLLVRQEEEWMRR